MKGGATYEDVLNMSSLERKAIKNIIEKNLETTRLITVALTAPLSTTILKALMALKT